MLKSRGVTIVEPGSGYLACGMTGSGRLADIEVIAQAVLVALLPASAQDLAGETILVTAGGTRESHRPGPLPRQSSPAAKWVMPSPKLPASAALRSFLFPRPPRSRRLACGCAFVPVTSAEEMRAAVMEHLHSATVVIGAAAVADFRMPAIAPEKLRREGSLHLDLEPTEDILRSVTEARAAQSGTLVIAFAAEMDSSISRARQKLLAKGADAIVLNDVSQPGIGFDSDLNAATFVTREHAIDIPEMPKRDVADRILDQLVTLRTAQLRERSITPA